MALNAGTRLGSYEITALLGAGGMGEVYRATDLNLKRQVALKVLPPAFVNDGDRLVRFQREAELLAALNHPNIAHIHGLEKTDGTIALVMELVEGRTLADRIAKGAIPIDEALPIAKQIADGLEAAHEQGIVHRDLKPANIKVREDGTVKILDFGLAKAMDPTGSSPGMSQSPTMTSPALTQAGVILGTAAYMSPEQAKGRPADKRSDIWAFGCVLYEMFTGEPLFRGETVSDVLAAILTQEPMLGAVPWNVRSMLRRCLEKDPKHRLRSVADAMLLFDEAADSRLTAKNTSRARWQLATIAALVAVVLIAVGAFYNRKTSPDHVRAMQLTIVPPGDTALRVLGGLNSTPAIAPDDSAVVFAARDGLRVRRLDALGAELIHGTEGVSNPAFWSPDALSIAFPVFNVLKRIRLPDGAPETITTLPSPSAVRGSWSDRGVIIVAIGGTTGSSDSSLYTVAASGGEAKRMETPLTHGRYQWPQFLPGGDAFVFSFLADGSEQVDVYLATLHDGRAENLSLLLRNDTTARYTAAGGGRLLFVRDGNLYSQKLDDVKRKLTGDPELIVQGVASAPAFTDAHFSVSTTGTVAWRPGRSPLEQVTIFDRHGAALGRAGPPGPLYRWIRLSPDDLHVLTGGTAASLLESGQPGRLTLGPQEWRLWTPDGKRLIGVQDAQLVERDVSGSGDVRPIAKVDPSILLADVSPDGKYVLYTAGGGGSAAIYTVRVDVPEADRIPKMLVQTGDVLNHPRFSPDGRWVVYMAAAGGGVRSGRGLYVQSFPEPGLRTQIASNGTYPAWRHDGKEIVYYGDDDTLWSIRVDRSGAELHFNTPERLFSVSRSANFSAPLNPLAISNDGSRIFLIEEIAQPESNVIHVAMGLLR